jgi:transposase
VSDTELLPKSKAEQPVRRMEVFTGAGRRRAWSAEEKARIVAESYDGGESVSAVARRHALTPQQLFSWRRATRRRVDVAPRPDGGGAVFAPVIVEAAQDSSKTTLAPTCTRGSPVIEIVIGAAAVRVSRGIDAATLATVLRAVKAAT